MKKGDLPVKQEKIDCQTSCSKDMGYYLRKLKSINGRKVASTREAKEGTSFREFSEKSLSQ